MRDVEPTEDAGRRQITALRRAFLTIAVPAWGIFGLRRNADRAAPVGDVTEEQLRELFSSDLASVPQLANARARQRGAGTLLR
jgi:hypothetical protein